MGPKSTVTYDVDGVPHTPILRGPSQFTFGVQENHKYGTQKEDQSPATLEGYQVMYSMNSMDTMDDPSPEEAAWRFMLIAITEKIWEEAQKVDLDDTDIPAGVHAVLRSGLQDQVVKPIFEHPKKDVEGKNGRKKKVPDISKPQRMYLKLESRRQKNGPPRPLTEFIDGDTNNTCSALDLIDVRGRIEPCIEFAGLYWGGHGKKPWAVSHQFKLYQALYTKQGDTSKREVNCFTDRGIVRNPVDESLAGTDTDPAKDPENEENGDEFTDDGF